MADRTDPFEAWRQWLDRSEHQINELMGEFTSSTRFSKAQARMMEALLKTQQGMNRAAERTFSAMNVPTRSDVLDLGGRIGQVEERLANIERVLLSMVGDRAEPPKRPERPPRTRRPPTAGAGDGGRSSTGKGAQKAAKKKTSRKKTSKKKTSKKKVSRKKTAAAKKGKGAARKVKRKAPGRKSS